MKILHVYKDFDPPVRGGMERHIALMCRFQRQWAEVEALTCSRSIWTRHVMRDGTPVTEVGEWGRFQSAPLAPRYPEFLRRIHADLLVVHVPNPTAEIGYLLARPRGRLVVRYHSDVVRQAGAMRVYKPFLNRFLRKADLIIPTSKPYLDTSAFLQPLRDRCEVVPLGIIPEDFDAPSEFLVKKYRETYGDSFVLFVGRHRYYKGLEYLVRAAERIDAPVVIAGDGPDTDELKALAGKLDARIHFPGSLTQNELIAHLHACSVFAFPSVERSEAFGFSILEAHACGRPVVATRLGTGVEYANLDGETGLNVAPRDSAALAVALNALLHDPSQAKQFGEAARRRVRREFDARDVAAREFSLYQDVIECSKTGI